MSVDRSWTETIAKAKAALAKGGTVYFKFTCEKCGVRQVFEEANTLYEEGVCGECHHITNLVNNGIGFLVVFNHPDKAVLNGLA